MRHSDLEIMLFIKKKKKKKTSWNENALAESAENFGISLI